MHNILRGDNFRLLVNEKCVAASRSCDIQINHQFEDISTKDSDGGWAESEPVEHSANGSVEALVTDGIYDAASNIRTITEISGGNIYESVESFKLQPGQTIWVSAVSGVKVSMNNDHSSPLVTMVGNTASYKNEGSSVMSIYLLSDTYNAKLDAYVTDDERATCSEILAAFFAGTPIDIQFAVTAGRNNIVVTDALIEGEAYINSLNLVATHKNFATFNMAFQVNGELERVEEESEL